MRQKKGMARKLFSILFAVVMMLTMVSTAQAANNWITVVSGIPNIGANTANAAGRYNGNWQYWSQGASRYSCMRASGCRVVAYSKMLAEIGCAPSDPDALFSWMGSKGYVNTSSCLELTGYGVTPQKYAAERGKTLTLIADPQISGSNANNANTIMNYINQGYYVCVLCSAHMAYIGRQASLNAGTPIILDSWSSYTSNPYTAIKYNTYTHNTFTRILVFRLNNSPIPIPNVSVTTTEAKNVTEKNAVVHGVVSKDSNIRSGMTVGIYFGESTGSMVKIKSETPSSGAYAMNNGTSFTMWYDLNAECNKTLRHATTYYWQCYATYGGKEYKGAIKSFTTPGSHSWGSGTITTQPTCTSTGVRTYTCSCGQKKTETVAKTAHTENSGIITKAATCTAAGVRTYSCSRCGTQLRTVSIPATGHTEDSGTITTSATCTRTGVRTYKCTKCGVQTRTASIPKTSHNWSRTLTVDQEATCHDSGSQSIHCLACGTVKDGSREVIPATGNHAWDAGKITKAATTTATGVKTFTCTVCGDTKTETIAKLPASAAQKDELGNTIVSSQEQEKTIVNQPNDNDPKGSTYSLLQARAKKVTKNSIKVTWKRVKGATAYVVYGNKCGTNNRFKKITTVKGTSYTQKKLKKGTYYKYLIVATGNGKALATSKTIHAATAGGKVGNSKAVKVNKTSVTLKPRKTFKIKASAVAQSKKLRVSKHRALAFETSNPKVATVNKKGVIKAVGVGKCKIYVYAQNGVSKAISVTVKK